MPQRRNNEAIMSDTKTGGKIQKSEAEWRKELTPMQYAVLREKATERPFSGEYEHEQRKGTYTCAGCGQTLFESDAKFDSGDRKSTRLNSSHVRISYAV